MNRKIILASAVLFAGTAGALALSYVVSPRDPFASCRDNNMVDYAEIGGPFTLTDETGATVRDSDIVDRPTLLYIGYTFCPDVCPLDNMRNADALYLLDERGVDARAVFVSVDPARDTPEVLTDFTDFFHPEMIGLTGEQDSIARMADAYHAVYEFQESDDEYYLIDHSTYTYVILPGHGVVDLVARDDAAEDVAARTQCLAEHA